MTFRLFTIFTILLASFNNTFSQGCSDAGFCTIGNLKQQSAESEEEPANRISVLLPLGMGDEGVLVFAPGLQYDRRFSSHWSMQGKILGNFASGNLGSVAGLGDIYLSGTYLFPHKKKWFASVTLGGKIPLNKGNLRNGSLSLPMQYQSSLGTFDAIAGITVSDSKWQFSAGYQQPLSGSNSNTFLASAHPDTNALAYPSTNRFTRRGDVLLRAAYTFNIKDKLSINASVLGIYHLGNDTYVNELGIATDIADSDGLTLNLGLAAWYKVSNLVRIGITAGMPVIVREVRPDGLTRGFVVAPEVSFSF